MREKAGPSRGQWIMRAGAKCPPQLVDCFVVISATAQHPTENAHSKSTVRVERERSACFGDCRLPFADHAFPDHTYHQRKDGMRHRILVVERYREARFFENGFVNIREGARRIEPIIP